MPTLTVTRKDAASATVIGVAAIALRMLHHRHCFGCRSFRQDDGEFFPSGSPGVIAGAQGISDNGRRRLKHFIADGMAIPVVYRLEVVQVMT